MVLQTASPPPTDLSSDLVVPNDTEYPFTFALSKVAPSETPGGSIRVVDQRTFKAAEKISAVEVTVHPGGMRYVFVISRSSGI